MIPHFEDKFKWLSSDLTVLICGKGPSFDPSKAYGFYGCAAGINFRPPTPLLGSNFVFSFCNDFDSLVKLNSRWQHGWVVSALNPHFIYDHEKPFVVIRRDINKLCSQLDLKVDATYELHTSPRDNDFYSRFDPVFCHASTFEACLTLFARLGIKKFKTLGIDGGSGYSSAFSGHPGSDDLRPRYDNQFLTVEALKKSHGIIVERL